MSAAQKKNAGRHTMLIVSLVPVASSGPGRNFSPQSSLLIAAIRELKAF